MSAKRKGVTPNVSSSGEADKLKKMSRKEIGKAQGGNPDSTDEKWITTWIDMYEKAYPGRIRRMSNDVATEVALSDINKFAEVSKDSGMRRSFWLPADLQEVLEASYPSFWTNPKHAAWFCRKFPQFAFETYAKRAKG